MLASAQKPFSLFQRPNSANWSVRFSSGGKQIRKSLETSDPVEAERRAYKVWAEANYRVENGLTVTVKPFRIVAGEFIDQVRNESERGERSEYHPRDWPPVIERYLVGFFGDKPIDTIREPDLERYIEWRRNYWVSGPGKDIEYIRYERGGKILRRAARHEIPSLSRQKAEMVIVRALFQQATRWGYTSKLDVPDIRVRKKEGNNRPSFAPEEYARLLEVSLSRLVPLEPEAAISVNAKDGRQWKFRKQNKHVLSDRIKLHCYIEIAAGSGMRPTEMKNLDWGHVLRFRQCRTKPINEQDIRFQVKGKSKYGDVVPDLGVVAWIHRLWDLFVSEVGREPLDSDPLFADHNGNRIQSFKKGFAELLKLSGLEKDFRGAARTTYSLRHYYISEKIAKGVAVYDVGRNTRTSIGMIDKHYGQVSTERIKDKLRPDYPEW